MLANTEHYKRVLSVLKSIEHDSKVSEVHRDSDNLPHREDGPAITFKDGKEVWCKRGVMHRDDGPAVIYKSGKKVWYKNGAVHREDGPAITDHDGREVWCRNDIIYREDGPAITSKDGKKEWYDNGFKHRDDGPAVIHPDGRIEWYENGFKHRGNGPAVIHPDGRKEWWFKDKFTGEDFGGESIYWDNDRGYTLQAMPDGSYRAGCRKFPDSMTAVAHWLNPEYPVPDRGKRYAEAILNHNVDREIP